MCVGLFSDTASVYLRSRARVLVDELGGGGGGLEVGESVCASSDCPLVGVRVCMPGLECARRINPGLLVVCEPGAVDRPNPKSNAHNSANTNSATPLALAARLLARSGCFYTGWLAKYALSAVSTPIPRHSSAEKASAIDQAADGLRYSLV